MLFFTNSLAFYNGPSSTFFPSNEMDTQPGFFFFFLFLFLSFLLYNWFGVFVFGDLLFFSFPFFSFFSLLFYIFIFCLRREGVILCYVEKEERVVFHHNCFFCLLVCIRFCVPVSTPSSSGFRRHTQTPSPGGWLFSLPNKIKIRISHEFVFISLSMCACFA